MKWSWRLLLVLYFAAGLLILAGRHFLMPEIASQRDLVEQKLSAAIGQPVKIASLSAAWPGFYPQLAIEGLQLHDQQGRPALAFERVEAEIGWSSLWHFGLHLHRLEIVSPVLDIRRDASGAMFVAGMPMQGEGEGGFVDWLLTQGRIVVRDARLVWHDELRNAPALELQHLNFDLRNAGRHHSFGLVAEPAINVATRLDLRGNFVGKNLADVAKWRGDLYAELERIDLAAWSPWIDSPLDWSRGSGGLRLWFTFEDLLPNGFTLDLSVTDVAVRLQPDLPVLELKQLHGRMISQRTRQGFVGEIKQLELETRNGIIVPPTNARLAIDNGKGREAGEFRASRLDFGALADLAEYLPLPAHVHERLAIFAPQGRLADFAFSWRGVLEALQHWQVKGRFDGLGLAAYHELPGFSGISGSLEGNERSGKVRIDSQSADIFLPTVFTGPKLPLESLAADIGWQSREGNTDQIDLLLSRIAFSNADASGEVTGRYRYTGQGPGEIDLSAKLTRGSGSAVWRYLPLVVNKDVRDWLRDGIVGGSSASTSLRLKGPLAEFPFKDGKSGIFQVKGAFQGATLKYASGWPEITDIDGELLFDGARMLIRGQRGKILGVALADVQAEIADLEQPEELLTVSGRAKGPTQRFLDFIEASPVGERIDHFTQTMTAAGQGELDLKLVLPLRRLADTQVDGRYRFADNQLSVIPGLPTFTSAQGEFSFTADRLQGKNLRARLFGVPLGVDVASSPGGVVRVNAAGKLAAQALRQEYGLRVFEHLSGETPWRGSVTVKKPGAEIRIESSLEGLSSSLPEPFNKSAREVLPLKLEGRIEPNRDAWTATLGSNVALNLQEEGGPWKGRIALGAAAVKSGGPSPSRGVTLAIAQPKLDADAWLNALSGVNDGNAKSAGPFAFAAIDLKSAELQLRGRTIHDLQLTGTRSDTGWRFGVDSREARGQLTWSSTGAGRITGRLSHLILPATDKPAAAYVADPTDATQELPAVDLVIDKFSLHDMVLGEVRVTAENRDGAWLAKLGVKNDAARLTGEGRWRPSISAPETALNFKLDVDDAEKLLVRLGLPDAMRRGAAQLDGDLTWAGAPFALDLPSLSGHLKIEAEKGQFKKLEPGVGRLLGVLSLQSLPRRITLDFRDVFSEGFAFDSIAGTASITRGLMKTDALSIRGPAAKVLIAGQANLVAETQDLKVRVEPAVGESIAVGAMIANPVVGAVAWAAQKMLNNPLDQAFAFEYAVTGGWTDPKVEKLTRNPQEKKTSPP